MAFFLGVFLSGIIGLFIVHSVYQQEKSEIVVHDPIEVFEAIIQQDSTPAPTQPPHNQDDIPTLININTATLLELERLPGIGPTFAKRIVEARPYKSISEIQKVSGIGSKRYSEIKDLISI